MERKIRIVNEYGAFSAIEINKAYVECREYIKHYKEVIEKLEKKIFELEAQIERDKELLEVKTAEVSISEDKILSCLCPYCGKIVAGKIPNGYKVNEEPLPSSSDEYEEDRIDKIEKVVLGIQSFLKKETEQKIKELEEEQERLMRETAHQRFISDLVRPLKP